jgi:hypothetical protein
MMAGERAPRRAHGAPQKGRSEGVVEVATLSDRAVDHLADPLEAKSETTRFIRSPRRG